MRVYEASTLISAEFGGIRDLSRHLSLNSWSSLTFLLNPRSACFFSLHGMIGCIIILDYYGNVIDVAT